MVCPASTDVAFVHKGLIVGYRRIDIGSRLLSLEYSTSADSPGAPAPGPISYEEYDKARTSTSGGGLNRLAAENLSVEVQRTLNYYQREFPDAAIEDHVYLAIDDVRIDDLAGELTMSLGVAIESIRPSLAVQDSPEPSTASGSRLGAIYSAAFGLAVHGQIMARVPRIDLFSKQREGVQQAETQRNFFGSIATSVLAILLGITGYILYHKQIVALQKEMDETNARTATIEAATNQTMLKRTKQEEQYKALRNEGAPVIEIMDFIANTIKPGTGLDSVVIAPDLTVTIKGDSTSESQMIDTNQNLQKCPVLTDMRIYSFNQLLPEEGIGVSFDITGKTVSVSRVRLPEDKKPGQSTTLPPGKQAIDIKKQLEEKKPLGEPKKL